MLYLYNTLTKKKEEFIPINAGKVGLYTCGPTVYGYIHIGNLRAYTNADVLRRYLEYRGFEVRHIKNITDVGHLTDDDIAQGDSGEDKMCKTAKKEKKTPEEIARFYEAYAKEKEVEMNILPAHFFPRATEHVSHMITFITTLIDKGYAYEKNGNVFFDVTQFPRYGALSGNTLERLHVGARLTDPHPDKKNQWDFALWLKAPQSHLMKWDAPWSVGYPGWHIECSAMSNEYLGDTFDIHTGGEDNIFPHHEAEIAQSECAHDKPFVRYWVHSRHLLMDGQKMSKSKGNLYTLEDIKDHGYTPMDLRMFFLLAHYRTQANFTWDTMQQAHKNTETIAHFAQRITAYTPHNDQKTTIDVATYKNDFERAMDDDLNTPQALTVLFDMITTANRAMDNGADINSAEITSFFHATLRVLGITITTEVADIPKDIHTLAQQRDDARKNNDFDTADQLRDRIIDAGYDITDTPDGYHIKKC